MQGRTSPGGPQQETKERKVQDGSRSLERSGCEGTERGKESVPRVGREGPPARLFWGHVRRAFNPVG